MKYIIALLLINSFAISIFSQTSTKDYIKIEESIPVKNLKYNIEKYVSFTHSELYSDIYNDTLFFFRTDLDNPNSISLFVFSLITNKYIIEEVDITEMIDYNRGINIYISAFATNNNYLIFSCYNGEGNFLFVYKKIDNRYIYSYKIPFENNLFSRKIKFMPNGKLLGLKNYVYAGENAEQSSALTILNIETKQQEKSLKVEFLLPGYTQILPYNILSVNDFSILLSQRGDYKIAEYDFDLNLIGIIENKKIRWDRMPQNLSDSIYMGKIGLRNSAFFALKDKYHCIHNIYSSKDKLFVFYSKSGNFENFYYDIWCKKNGNWDIIKTNISDTETSLKFLYQHSLLPNVEKEIYFLENNKFLRLGFYVPNLGNLSKKKYKKAFEKYYTENELPFNVEIISFNIK